MRYFVTILTLYINSSRAYTLYAYARSKYVYGRASRTLRKKNGEKRNRRNGGRKRKEKRAQGDLLLMKNKYTTHADEPFPSFLFDQFLLSPYRFLETLSFFYPILSNAHIYVYAYMCVYTCTHTCGRTTVHRNIRFYLCSAYIRFFASTLARVNVQIIK